MRPARPWSNVRPVFFWVAGWLMSPVVLRSAWRRWVVGAVLVGCLASAWTSAAAGPTAYRVPWENGRTPCWDAAGAYHGIDPWLLYAIGYVESGHNPTALNLSNGNGTRDIGMMQINSIWIPELRRHGIPTTALTNACASTYIGAWVLAKNIRRYGYTWQAIAVYNVGSLNTPGRVKTGQAYARKVYAAYGKLTRERAYRRLASR